MPSDPRWALAWRLIRLARRAGDGKQIIPIGAVPNSGDLDQAGAQIGRLRVRKLGPRR
ncbi:MAG TPA: hypothetical protein VJ305_06670 [Streptosporangiaceae bacterium]|nr:hypothetical protein [Streptosporangiaceae bacterium]